MKLAHVSLPLPPKPPRPAQKKLQAWISADVHARIMKLAKEFKARGYTLAEVVEFLIKDALDRYSS